MRMAAWSFESVRASNKKRVCALCKICCVLKVRTPCTLMQKAGVKYLRDLMPRLSLRTIAAANQVVHEELQGGGRCQTVCT